MPGAPDPTEVRKRLAELEEAERSLSARRRRLHDRIDFMRGGGAADDNSAAETLDRLLEEERQVSAKRLAVHGQIDELLVAAGLPPFRRPRSGGLDQQITG